MACLVLLLSLLPLLPPFQLPGPYVKDASQPLPSPLKKERPKTNTSVIWERTSPFAPASIEDVPVKQIPTCPFEGARHHLSVTGFEADEPTSNTSTPFAPLYRFQTHILPWIVF